MKNRLLKLTALSLIASSSIYAAAYKIPETSVNALALGAATVAHASGADTAYYNPANMAFMKDENNLDINLMMIALEASNFKSTDKSVDIDAQSEQFLIPSTHFVSKKYDDFRFGFSFVVPGGLTKRWEVAPAIQTAKEFTLTVIEMNPTVSYLINDNFAVAIGARAAYKIPETSVNALALGAATVAHASGADTAYYNPANMAFMKDENNLDINLMMIALEASNFKSTDKSVDIDAQSEQFLIPSTHFVSKKYDDFRFGFSFVVPGGLTKRWEVAPAIQTAKEFTLTVIEMNPTVSYLINDNFAVAIGARAVYSQGVVKSSSTASRDMIGESFDFGYNLALSYKPTSALEFGLTYRSEIDLSEEGNAKLYFGDTDGVLSYNGGSSVTVPLPALLNIAVAYTFESKTTLELVYEKNFWSAYDTLDFNYADTLESAMQAMDYPIAKDWEDTNVLRIGITQELDKMSLMAGLVIDETPVPDDKVSFELPDSDGVAISFGGRYKIDDNLDLGLSAMYLLKESRTASPDDIDGEFASSATYLVSTGLSYKF